MMYKMRSFQGERDLLRMSALAQKCFDNSLHVIDLPYRFSSWAFDDPGNVGLWEDEAGQLVGWAVVQTPFWKVDFICQPEQESSLFPEMLDWAVQRARFIRNTTFGRPSWYVSVFADASERTRMLERAGFTCQSHKGEDSWSEVLMRRPGGEPVELFSLAPGFTLRPLAGEQEAAAYVDLHRAVFRSTNMTVEWRRRMLQQPTYFRDLDLVVTAPDGRLAAFCIGWWDEQLQAGHIEPLGCHADFWLHVLGRVVLSECLRRMVEMGARDIYVQTDRQRNAAMRLYEAYGFKVVREVLVYGRDIP